MITVDLSVLIDGRIYDIVKTNFLSLNLIVTSLVVDELKSASKSSNNVMRSRSKIALAIIEKLRKSKIITKDFNLYKKASLYGTTVLNINDLEYAIYPLFLLGEKVHVHLVKEGS